MHLNTITHADALTYARSLPTAIADCIIASPPYWHQRDYQDPGQWGLEPTLQEYVGRLVELFNECRRVLNPNGTLWLNLGDTYVYDFKHGGSSGGRMAYGLHGQNATRARTYTGLADGNLAMVPARVAIALQDIGWVLRAENVWAKPNAMPSSATNRTTRAHEMLYMLTLCASGYYYDADAIAEPCIAGDKGSSYTRGKTAIRTIRPTGTGPRTSKQAATGRSTYTGFNARWDAAEAQGTVSTTRNRRSVLTIAPEPFAEAHFAVMPSRLAELCVLAGSPRGGLVFDPFMGSGTTALVARRHGRDFIGCDINADYVAMANERLAEPYTPSMF